MEFSLALLTAVIAVIGTIIAVQQLRINAHKVKLEKYERRLEVYRAAIKLFSQIQRESRVSYEDLLGFRIEAAEAEFLFGEEVIKFIDELYQHGIKLEYWHKQYCAAQDDRPANYDHEKVTDGMQLEAEWFRAKFHESKLVFKNYLDLRKW